MIQNFQNFVLKTILILKFLFEKHFCTKNIPEFFSTEKCIKRKFYMKTRFFLNGLKNSSKFISVLKFHDTFSQKVDLKHEIFFCMFFPLFLKILFLSAFSEISDFFKFVQQFLSPLRIFLRL